MEAMKGWSGCIFMVLLCVAGRPGLADDESDRNGLIRDIDDKIGRIADRLDGFDRESDASRLGDALSYARDVKDLVSQLDRVKGDDSRANEIVSRYPGYIDQFFDASQYLRTLKNIQYRWREPLDQCAREEADLQTLIRYYVGRPDAVDEALDKLPDKARELAGREHDALDKLRDLDRDVQDAANNARFSVSDSYRWPDVASKFSDAQQRIAQSWKDRYAIVVQNCGRLAMGEKHPDVEKALDDLRRYSATTKQTVTQLKKDYNEWLRGVRKLRELTQQDRDEIRTTFCTAGYYEMERQVDDVADRWATTISSAYGTTLGQSDRLMDRANDDKLKNFKGAAQVREGIKANRANLEKLRDYDLKGRNDPYIRTRLEYGIKMHDDREASVCSSGYKEFFIDKKYCDNAIRDDSNCRADCVVPASKCMVIEIKPDNERAKTEGRAQADAYAAGLRNWYLADKATLFEAFPKLQQCEKDGKDLDVGADLDLYSFCPSESDARTGLGPDIPEPADVSESSE